MENQETNSYGVIGGGVGNGRNVVFFFFWRVLFSKKNVRLLQRICSLAAFSLSSIKKKVLHLITYKVHKCPWRISESYFIWGRREKASAICLLSLTFSITLSSTHLTGAIKDAEVDQISFFLSPG